MQQSDSLQTFGAVPGQGALAGGASAQPGFCPSASSAAQRAPGTAFQDFYKKCCAFSLSQQQGKFPSVPGSPPALALQLAASSPCCSWAFLPSVPGNFFGHPLALLSSSRWTFPFRCFCSDLSLDIYNVSWSNWSERGKRSKASILNPKITIWLRIWGSCPVYAFCNWWCWHFCQCIVYYCEV